MTITQTRGSAVHMERLLATVTGPVSFGPDRNPDPDPTSDNSPNPDPYIKTSTNLDILLKFYFKMKRFVTGISKKRIFVSKDWVTI